MNKWEVEEKRMREVRSREYFRLGERRKEMEQGRREEIARD